MSNPLVWLITGTSSGIGRELALAALARDLKQAGAATLELDVTSPLEELHGVAKEAIGFYGQVDVLVNNAGYMMVGAIEESTPEETVAQFNTNLFGALNVTRAFLPYMRTKKTGIVMWMGSIGGWQSVPYGGIYATTKWAMRGVRPFTLLIASVLSVEAQGLSETLNDELKPLGLKSISIDLGYFRTSFLQDTQRGPAVSRIPDYQPLTDAAEARFQAYNGKQPGNPAVAVELLVDLAHGTGATAGKPFPIVLNLGSDSYSVAKRACEDAIARLEEWKGVSFSTDLEDK
ncbi:hypothetical protein NMY22_g11300 [Coprinellus aureogranulatus]|nr:hypothetical protein NMY22_g11300 [Coprinellus aureogranulatus]